MTESTYFWQGKRKVEIEQKPDVVTIETPSVEFAFEAAKSAGVEVTDIAPVSNMMVRMRVRGDRDQGMAELRDKGHILHHVYNIAGNPQDQVLITESFYLKFKDGVSEDKKAERISSENLEIVKRIDTNTYLVKVTDATGTNPLKSANKLAEDALVEYAEPNIIHSLQRFENSPLDELFPRQWHLHTPSDGVDLVKDAGIDVISAWAITRGRRDIVVCVADDGFDLTHPDLKGVNKLAGQINIAPSGIADITIDLNVQPRPGNYHGTPCAGVAVAEVNDEGAVGVAPGCAFLPVRFPLNLTDYQLAKMFEHVSPQADIISCSWGYGPANRPMSSELQETVTRLASSGGRRGQGLIFCVAAGNNNCPVKDLGNTKTYKYMNRGTMMSYSGPVDRWLATHPNVLTVSASTSLKTRAAYSSWGKEISVCAPSNNFDDLQRFKPRGLGIVTTDNEGAGAATDFEAGSRYTSNFGGTSSATPTVAGVCALVLSANPALSALQVRNIIQDTADKDLIISSETQVNEPGNFINGFSLWFGHGKVNASKAVKAASLIA